MFFQVPFFSHTILITLDADYDCSMILTEGKPIKEMTKMDDMCKESSPVNKTVCPAAPPFPGSETTSYRRKGMVMDESPLKGQRCVSTATRDLWDRLFDEAYGADVLINTDNGGIIYAHASILVSSSFFLHQTYITVKALL